MTLENWALFLAFFGIGALGLGLSGSAIGLSIAGSAVTGMRDEKRGQGIAVSVLPGTQGLYSFAIGFLCLQKLGPFLKDPALMDGRVSACVIVFAAGIVTGLACLFSGWYQGVVCAAGIKSINQEKMAMGQALLLAVFPEFYAILSLAFSALMLMS
jgi:V/A-type H+-transporting ATPase subunit K